MRTFLATLALLAILASAILYANGWLTFQRDDAGTNIQIHTPQINRAAEEAVENSKRVLRDSLENDPAVRPIVTPNPNPAVAP